jgi:hypothetical protein
MSGGPSQEFILPRLQKALARAGHTHDFERDVVPMLMDGRAQWWGNDKSVVITEIQRFPNYSVLNYWLVAGELQSCLDLQPEIDRWARLQGCARAIGMGRQGFLRVLPRYGWMPYAIGMWKDLRQ